MREKEMEAVRTVLAGNVRAYGVLVDRYKEKGMGLAFRMLRNREEAEEALQDAFVRAYRGLTDFEGSSAFGTWFYRILFNVCSSRLEGHRLLHVSMDDEATGAVGEIAAMDPLPDVQFETQEFEEMIRSEVERLPEPFGSTFALFALQELAYEEIAEITGAPLGTVKARIFRARTQLRAALGRRLGEQPMSAVDREGERS